MLLSSNNIGVRAVISIQYIESRQHTYSHYIDIVNEPVFVNIDDKYTDAFKFTHTPTHVRTYRNFYIERESKVA